MQFLFMGSIFWFLKAHYVQGEKIWAGITAKHGSSYSLKKLDKGQAKGHQYWKFWIFKGISVLKRIALTLVEHTACIIQKSYWKYIMKLWYVSHLQNRSIVQGNT